MSGARTLSNGVRRFFTNRSPTTTPTNGIPTLSVNPSTRQLLTEETTSPGSGPGRLELNLALMQDPLATPQPTL